MADGAVESELKIPVSDLDPIRESLRGARAVEVRPMARETNLLLDSDDGRLATSGSLLRLRRHAGRTILTFKGPARYSGAVKQRPEYETEIGDAERLGDIFEQLGFKARMRYEKDREEWRLEEVEVALDHTPMGDFVELEGPPDSLGRTARLLGLDVDDAVRGSYVTLWREHRARHPERQLPSDMVFVE